MNKRLSVLEIARYELVLAVLLCCALAGCAVGGDNSDNDSSRHGFYTGVSGGMTTP